MKKMIKILMGVLLLLIVFILGFVIAVAVTSGNKVTAFVDEQANVLPNSIAEKISVPINGRENGMFIRGKDKGNPVLLFISGGPGVPQYWLNEAYREKYPNRLEEYFTVCWWDYMGEGLSYDKDIGPEEITVEKLAEDAAAVAEYLQERFGVEKVYLMAHSGGTPLGLYLAQNDPDHFYCYFAMGQEVETENGRYEDGYYFMKEVFEQSGNEKGLRMLNRLAGEENGEFVIKKPDEIRGAWESVLLMAGCATTREMRSDALEIFFPQIFSGCYTFTEKLHYWQGKALLSQSSYAEYGVGVDEPKPAQIPVYFISGYYDYTTPVTQARKLYEALEAPDKAFYEFADSAHSPLWEENDAVLEVMSKYVG